MHVKAIGFLFCILLSLSSVAAEQFPILVPSEPVQLTKNCNIRSDQLKSFTPPIPQTMKLIVDNRFSKDEKKSILKAADAWNKAGLNLTGKEFFTVAFEDLPEKIESLKNFGCDDQYGGTDYTYVVNVTDNSLWNLVAKDQDTRVPGVMNRCFHPITFQFYQQILRINTNIAVATQFESIVLHELGHGLGLSHSCDSLKNKKDADPQYVSCQDISDGSDYHSAVMYPSLATNSRAGQPEQKTELTKNDLARLACLYERGI